MKFYCNKIEYNNKGLAHRLQLHFNKGEVEHLGGEGMQLSISRDVGSSSWLLQPTGVLHNKRPKIYPVKRGSDLHYWTTCFMKVTFPVTGLTDLPYDKVTSGFRLYPEKAELHKIRSPLHPRVLKDTEPQPVSPKLSSEPPRVSRRAKANDPLVDLRAAISIINEEAERVGATLELDSRGKLRARIYI